MTTAATRTAGAEMTEYTILISRDGETWEEWGAESTPEAAQSQVWSLEDELGSGCAKYAVTA